MREDGRTLGLTLCSFSLQDSKDCGNYFYSLSDYENGKKDCYQKGFLEVDVLRRGTGCSSFVFYR